MYAKHLCSPYTLYFVIVLLSYHGSFAVPGPDLIVLNATEKEIHVKWTAVREPGVIVEKYQVSAFPVKSYGSMGLIIGKEWNFSNTTLKTELMGLHPGTYYNVSVWAKLTNGLTEPSTEHVWTEVGEPDSPPPVEIIYREGKTMIIHLPSGTSINGPITGYLVVTLEKVRITFFNHDDLGSYRHAQESDVPYYITADLTPDQANQTFVVGDQKTYGGYYNAPLQEDREYEILSGVVSSLNGITKVAYSSLQSTENSFRISDTNGMGRSSALSVALSAAIGVCGFLLVLSVIIYFLLRNRYGRRRPSDELVLQPHGFNGEENGFLPGALHLDSDTDLTEFYDQLKEHYWQIPKSSIDVQQTVLGIGQFGEVREGTVHRRSQTMSCLIQHTSSPATLGDKDKRSLLKELDTMARIGFHPNVVEFIGACEDRGIVLAAIEHHSSSLRGLLLRNRQQNNGQICNLSEHLILEICSGIAQGMSHLADRGIIHHHLSARNVLIAEGSIPKIAHFGIGHYYPLGKKLLYTRWTSPEVLNGHTPTSKSDVWSFGVLLWEVFTLGGSPYPFIPVQDLVPRLMQGMRLPRPKCASSDAYQSMLHCWELDPEERPKFMELSNVLQYMFLNSKDHVNFQFSDDFQHERFDPNAEDD